MHTNTTLLHFDSDPMRGCNISATFRAKKNKKRDKVITMYDGNNNKM